MKKFYICAILLFSFFFSSYVKADSINVGIVNTSGTVTGNLYPYNWVNNVSGQNNNFVVNGTALDGTLKQGQRYQVVSKFCSRYASGTWSINLNNSTRIILNNYNISVDGTSCVHTDSNGNVNTGTGIITITVDLTIGDISSNGTFQGNFHINRDTGTGTGGIGVGFLSYDILDAPMIQDNENTQEIISNQDTNTDRIIQNDNANTDRLINNANANSQAEIDATNRNTQAVNDVNNSINSTDTTGSENALSSIVNDPAFQDTTGINSIITLPLTMISSLSNTCQPINVTIPFINSSATLPCFRSIINQHMPLLGNMISIVINGFILYRVFIDIVGIIKSARNPDDDRLDVLEL